MTTKDETDEATKGRILGEILKDWERLKKQENNIRRALEGADMIAAYDRIVDERDRWAASSVRAQLRMCDLQKLVRECLQTACMCGSPEWRERAELALEPFGAEDRSLVASALGQEAAHDRTF